MPIEPIEGLELVEIAFAAASFQQEAASQIRRPRSGGCISRRIDAGGHAIVGLDLILNINGDLNLIEANGSNQAGSSFGAPDGDLARAVHQVEAARDRISQAQHGVVLIAYARGTGAMPEIVTRAALIKDLIHAIRPCRLADTTRPPAAGSITVVVDTVENIADHITAKNCSLHYAGLPVLSAANPNLLPELVRRGVIARDSAGYVVDTTVFHDGPLVSLIHDKGAQQELAAGTGIVPLRWRACDDTNACIATVLEMQARGLASVVKINAGSGGAGIGFFAPTSDSEEVADGLAKLIAAAGEKYGDNTDRSIWPLRVFEFAESSGYPLADGLHLWDMRIVGLIRPGIVDLTFCGIRVCPEPFVPGRYEEGAVLSNVTGRRPDLSTTRSPLVEFGRPTKHLRTGGVDQQVLERVVDAAARWIESAWAHATKTSPLSAGNSPHNTSCEIGEC